MSITKLKRAATGAACAVGITVGAVAMATPAAAAGIAYASYDCSPYGNPVDVEFVRDGSNHLTLNAALTFTVPPGGDIPAGGIQGELVGNQSGLTNTNPMPAGTYGAISLEKANSVAIPSAPGQIKLTITPPGVVVTCNLIPGTASGFPI